MSSVQATQGQAPGEAVVPHTLAALDLGSNSFHLVVARVENGALHVIDRLREPVRLAAGLDERRILSDEAQGRALDCIARFAQRVHGVPRGGVRAVGTNTLRRARNGEQFRQVAERTLGHRIEVIAGREEARLIYLGVAHALAGDRRRRLVVDIGGGSTEFIVGEGFDTVHRESLYMGCVSMTGDHFGDGRVDKTRMRAAELAARVELEPIEAQFRAARWQTAVGCSGTIRTVESVLKAAGWVTDGISRGALRKLRKAMVEAGSAQSLNLKELRDDRRPVFAGGVAVLGAVFEALGIEHMTVSEMALREGLMYDLLGRFRHEDIRDVTVRSLAERHGVDAGQAARVARTALACLSQVAGAWELEDGEMADILRWAAHLHEVGLVVSHNLYHKHGGYLVANADLAGFSRQEQAVLAGLVRGHRRKFPVQVLDALQEPAPRARRLCVLLRLAALLHRSRQEHALPPFRLRVEGTCLAIAFADGWLDGHPLTRADLAQERSFLAAAGFTLDYA